MNKLPLVSVIMSAYNHEKYVEQAVESIMGQTYKNIELIVIDDGSTDQTSTILSKLSCKHGFYFIRQFNQGFTKTLNSLLKKARGEYISICASDDFWPQKRLEEQVHFAQTNNSLIVHGLIEPVGEDGAPVEGGCPRFEMLASGLNAYQDRLRGRKRFFTGTILFHRSVYEQIGGYDENISVEDVDWFLRASKSFPVLAANKCWLYYRRHEQNWTRTKAGIRNIFKAQTALAIKLGIKDGPVFLYFELPGMFSMAHRAGSGLRFISILLLPIYIFQLGYLHLVASIILGEKTEMKMRRSIKYLLRRTKDNHEP